MVESRISCDYLVVGAGTSCLSFVDTVLSMRKDATFVIVDRFSAPGGHWTKAYPFVRLHQPSCYYGVNSLPLAKLDKNGNEPYDQNVRASAKEICEYYKQVVENFKATGRVRVYFETNYEGEAKNPDGSTNVNSGNYNDPAAKITHTITTKNGETMLVDCTKVVRCETNVVVPSMRDGLPFPVDDAVESVPLNELPSRVGPASPHENYLVIGGGKSGVDAITYLVRDKQIRHDQITWIVPRPAWYFIRDHIQRRPKSGTGFWKDAVRKLFDPIIAANSANEGFLNMEKLGVAQRVDPNDGHFPTIFKGATLDQSEMDDLRKIKNVVSNKGRVTSITANEVIFANGEHSIPFSPTNTLVVDCTVEEMYGYLEFDEDFQFFNPHKIRLGPLTSLFNPSHTSAQVGFLESEYSDTAAGDEMKNSFLYFARGTSELKEKGFLATFLVLWYAHQRTDLEFGKCPSYRKFVLSARTDRQQPAHHGGILGLLWAVLGPTKLLQAAVAYREKMENGGYEDFPTNPLPGRKGADASKHEANLRNPTVVKKKQTIRDRLHSLHEEQNFSKARRSPKPCELSPEKKSSSRNTVATVEIHA